MTDHLNLNDILTKRVTSKVLADPKNPLPPKGLKRSEIDEWLNFAGQAPFHHQAERGHKGDLSSPVPWRMYKFDAAECRALLTYLTENADAGKICDMLAACDAMVLATWTPDLPNGKLDEELLFNGTERNMEHIAAASAAVQNLLLLATEAGWRTYWSSGGVLRTPQIFNRYGISTTEILLGAIFVYPQDVGDAEIKKGKLCDARGKTSDWSRWVSA